MSSVKPSSLPTLTSQYAQSSSSRRDSADEVAREAFEQAKEIFSSELTSDDIKRSWVNGQTSLEDVKQALCDAARAYEARTSRGSAVKKWLTRLSARIQVYGVVLDVLSQHHPEYVALAWGAFKFLFTVLINHETLAKGLSKTLTKIAGIMSKAGADLQLYPTAAIQNTVARLYACLLRVAIKALRWFNQGRFGHAVAAIVRSWDLEFEEEVAEMEEHFAYVTSHAVLAARAEIRDMHIAFQSVETRAATAEEAAVTARAELHALHSTMRSYEQRVATAEHASVIARAELQSAVHSMRRDLSMHFNEIKLDLRDNKEGIHGIIITQISGLPFAKDLPSPGSCLGYCLSFQRRAAFRTKANLRNIRDLETWSSGPSSCIFALQTRSLLAAKDYVVTMVETIRDSECHILWALRYPGFEDATVTTVSILQMLVMQSLHLKQAVTTSWNFAIRPQHLEEAAHEQDWLHIFAKVIEDLIHVFIILDPDLMSAATGSNQKYASSFIERLLRCTRSTVLKIFISAISVELSEDDIARPDALWVVAQAKEPQRGPAKRLRQILVLQPRRVRARK